METPLELSVQGHASTYALTLLIRLAMLGTFSAGEGLLADAHLMMEGRGAGNFGEAKASGSKCWRIVCFLVFAQTTYFTSNFGMRVCSTSQSSFSLFFHSCVLA